MVEVTDTSSNAFTNRRRVKTSPLPIPMWGHGRERFFEGAGQSCYNSRRYNGRVDAVLADFVITRIHREGHYTGWFSIREVGMGQDGNRTFYVKGDSANLGNVTVQTWWDLNNG